MQYHLEIGVTMPLLLHSHFSPFQICGFTKLKQMIDTDAPYPGGNVSREQVSKFV